MTASIRLLGKTTPTSNFYTITPADAAVARPYKALYTTTVGNVIIQNAAGDNITLTAVPAFTFLPFSPAQVRTGTTATVLGLA